MILAITANQMLVAILLLTIGFILYLLKVLSDLHHEKTFYKTRYHQEPRVYHYKRRHGWKFWVIAILIIAAAASCTKEAMIADRQCYTCSVRLPGLQKSFDTCMADIAKLDMTNTSGTSLPWVCAPRQ